MNNQKIRKHVIEDRLKNASDELEVLFNKLNSQILKLTDVHNYATGAYIGYKQIISNSPIVEMHIRKRKNILEIHLRPINDSFPILNLRKVPDSHLWKLNTIKDVYVDDDLKLVMDLIKKSYEQVYSLSFN